MNLRRNMLVGLLLWLMVFLASCGSTAGNADWNYVALGDSLAVGLLALQEGYVPRYQGYIQTDTGKTVNLNNLGVNGRESPQLLSAIETDPNTRSALSSAQVITFDIGGDDLLRAYTNFLGNTCGGADNQDCLRTAVSTLETDYDQIVSQLLMLRGTNVAIIRTMDIYNPQVAIQQSLGIFNIVDPYLEEADAHIAQTAAANNIPMAHVHAAFNGPNGDQDAAAQGLMAPDNVHPNDNGHKVIADQLRSLGYAPLH